ncbi:hypothetical protein [Hoeflea sp. TYP-13]|uniref:hypothetical protein n=1 Tax=Hoeflea sp. TYP-13 TaxID=3230023 RepID=UPI0034C681E6
MKICPYTKQREEIVAHAIRSVASELRLIDAGDLIALLKLECHSDLADLVSSAAELFFQPGTVNFGVGGDYQLDWGTTPQITLDIELKPDGMTVFARLTLLESHGQLEINHISFDDPSADPDENTAFLAASLQASSFNGIELPSPV